VYPVYIRSGLSVGALQAADETAALWKHPLLEQQLLSWHKSQQVCPAHVLRLGQPAENHPSQTAADPFCALACVGIFLSCLAVHICEASAAATAILLTHHELQLTWRSEPLKQLFSHCWARKESAAAPENLPSLRVLLVRCLGRPGA